jgi:hypothetical protein
MTDQTPSGDTGKGVKNSSHTGQKPITTRTLTGVVLVLLSAFVVGIGIREFRFRSAGQKQPIQASKVVQPRDIPEIRQAPKEPEIRNIREQLPIEEVFVKPELPAPEPVSPPPTTTVDTDSQSNTETQARPIEQDSFDEDPQVKEQRGRIALGMIGYDPDADDVWISIINDPSVSPNARSNLIEDLNEDGLSYRNLTMDDLPVIEYRLELIEDLLPYAMDQVNEDAFKEARKDLENMVNRLRGR